MGDLNLGALWGGIRDFAVLTISLFTFGGLVYYHYYLQEFGIPQQALEIGPTNVFVFAMTLFTRYLGWIVCIGLLLGAGWLWLIALKQADRRAYRRLRVRLLSTVTRVIICAVALTVMFTVAQVDGENAASRLRTGNSAVLTSITFKDTPNAEAKSSKSRDASNPADVSYLRQLPQPLLAADKPQTASLIPVLETTDSYYLLVQDLHALNNGEFKEYPNGVVFEISKSNVAVAANYIPNFEVRR